MIEFIGIDPSLRHTGICYLKENSRPIFHEIQPKSKDILSAAEELRNGIGGIRTSFPMILRSTLVVSLEKQLSIGAHTSALMFYIQMVVLETLNENFVNFQLVMILPVQLKSYMRTMANVDIRNATTIVRSFKNNMGYQGRISQHCVDAYYLARAAKDVQEGRWSYKLPSKEQPLHPWDILHGGDRTGPSPGGAQEVGKALQG